MGDWLGYWLLWVYWMGHTHGLGAGVVNLTTGSPFQFLITLVLCFIEISYCVTISVQS